MGEGIRKFLDNTMSKKTKPKYLLIDVDGVMTTGQFLYTKEGKMMKVFGPDDNDALSLLKDKLNIIFVTGDRKGFPISKKRIAGDMKHKLELVSTVDRVGWIKKQKWNPQEVIYIGDGIFDHYVFREIGYGIAPANAFYLTRKLANFVTKQPGGDRAVAEACLHILEKFFEPYSPDHKLKGDFSGEWQV